MGAVRSQLIINDGMTAVLKRINRAMGLVLNNFEAVQRASGRAIDTQHIAVARQEIGRANAALDEMEENYRRCNQEQEQLNKRISTGSSKANSLLSKIKGMVAAYIGINAVKGLFNLSDTLTGTEARLNLIVDDGGSVEELKKKIFDSAQRARAGYVDTLQTVSKLGLVAPNAFKNNNELIAFAELVNKNFVIGGASATEASSAMYQLTQALGSGRLQGDEYRSIIENAPLLAKAIEDYMRNVRHAEGTMKDWAAEGKLTADVIKAAVFRSADEIEERFNKMPMTWGQVWNSMKNKAVVALDGVLSKINQLANDQRVQTTVDSLIGALGAMATVLLGVFGLVSGIYTFFASNWSWIGPIVWGIVAAIIAYNTALAINNTIQGISNAIKTMAAIAAVAHGTATVAEAAATTGMTAAQVAFNAALYACPLTWIILLIIAIIVLIYAVIGAINKLTGSSISATGVILGALAAAGAFVWDLFLGIFELILGIINYLINPFIEFANFIANVFKNPISSIIYLFQGLADNVLGILQKIASALDFIFGSNMADTVQGWRNSLKGKADAMVAEYAPNENYQKVISNLDLSVEGLGLKRVAYSDAWSAGYKAGENIDASISNMFNMSDITNTADTLTNALGTGGTLSDIADDTASLSENSNKSTEELAYLRDIAEKEAINRFTTAEVKVELGGITNNVAANTDLDGVIGYLADELQEALITAAEGVHY